jgi:hypothetical protein
MKWENYRRELAAHIEKGDLAEFRTWPFIQGTMLADGAPYLPHEAKHVLLRSMDATTIHHIYHLNRFSEFTGDETGVGAYKAIVEFGGGYGNMCRIVSELNFKGRYTLVDLPEFLDLQRHYLENECGIYSTEFSELIPDEIKPGTLFIATWSLSEIPILCRASVDFAAFDSILIAFQKDFEGIDNLDYFVEIEKSLQNSHLCQLTPIEHMRGCINWYFFAKRK